MGNSCQNKLFIIFIRQELDLVAYLEVFRPKDTPFWANVSLIEPEFAEICAYDEHFFFIINYKNGFHGKSIITFCNLSEVIKLPKGFFQIQHLEDRYSTERYTILSRFEHFWARIRSNLCLWCALFFSTSIMKMVFMEIP